MKKKEITLQTKDKNDESICIVCVINEDNKIK